MVFLYVLIILIVVLILSTIKIKINYLKIEKNELKLTIYFYLFNKIKYFKFSKKINLTNAIKYKNVNTKLKNSKKYIPIIKRLKVNIDKFELIANIGIMDINITNLVVFLSSISISFFLSYLYNKPNIIIKDINYYVKPFYKKDIIQIDFKSLISIDLKNVIYILFLLIINKKRELRKQKIY